MIVNNCKCLGCGSDFNSKKNSIDKFCGKSCSAIYHNSRRKLLNISTGKGSLKPSVCVFCRRHIEISKFTSHKSAACRDCSILHYNVKTGLKQCPFCSKTKQYNKFAVYCSPDCLNAAMKNARSMGGKNSAFKQGNLRRSSNEIYFAELCKQDFSNVLTNMPLFNGWDADIILPDLKIAILWNGVWHYKQITKFHSVLQVQNRDKIKMQEIRNCGYMPYIIKDEGSKNFIFVQDQYQIFKKWYLEQNLHLHPTAYETVATTI